MDNCDDEIEKWEALEEKLSDGETVYAPVAKTRKRKRSLSSTDGEDEDKDQDKDSDDSDDESQSSTQESGRSVLGHVQGCCPSTGRFYRQGRSL
jgi:hypothetical protein